MHRHPAGDSRTWRGSSDSGGVQDLDLLCWNLEGVQSVGRNSQGPVGEADPRQFFLVHRLDNQSSWDTQTARCRCRSQNLGMVHSAPPSFKPSLPWSTRMTVASSSRSPGAIAASSMTSRASSSASNTRNASSRLRTRSGGTGSSPPLTRQSLVDGCQRFTRFGPPVGLRGSGACQGSIPERPCAERALWANLVSRRPCACSPSVSRTPLIAMSGPVGIETLQPADRQCRAPALARVGQFEIG